jgi:hypothetical protein
MYAQMDQRTGEALLISKPIPLPALNVSEVINVTAQV